MASQEKMPFIESKEMQRNDDRNWFGTQTLVLFLHHYAVRRRCRVHEHRLNELKTAIRCLLKNKNDILC